MITDDEVMRLFERADPARIEDAAAVADRPVDLATLRTRSSNVTLIDTEPTPTRPPNRHRLLIIISAAAAVVLIVAGAIVLATRDADEPQHPVAPPTTVTPAQPAAEEIARGFIDAERVTFDADRAITYLSGEALVDVGGSREEYRLLLSFLQRTGSDTINIECEQRDDTAAGVVVRCSYDQHMFRSDELGLGPYTGNYQDLTVHDGTIVEVSGYSPLEPFSSEIWTPFKQWVSTEYPDDVELMYDGGGWRITENSIPLWEQRIEEYVRAVLTGSETYAADVGAICATQASRLGELAAPAGGALDQVAAWHAAAAAILERAHGALIALHKPPAIDTAYTSFYGRLIRLVRIVEESAEAATAGDSTRLAELNGEYVEVRQRMSSDPTGSGLEACEASLPG